MSKIPFHRTQHCEQAIQHILSKPVHVSLVRSTDGSSSCPEAFLNVSEKQSSSSPPPTSISREHSMFSQHQACTSQPDLTKLAMRSSSNTLISHTKPPRTYPPLDQDPSAFTKNAIMRSCHGRDGRPLPPHFLGEE